MRYTKLYLAVTLILVMTTSATVLAGYNIITIPMSEGGSLAITMRQLNNNGQVVWTGPDNEIYLYDGYSTHQLTYDTLRDVAPSINDKGQVVWVKWNNQTDADVYFYDGISTRQLTSGPYADGHGGINNKGQILLSRQVPPFPGQTSPQTEMFFYDGNSIRQLTNTDRIHGSVGRGDINDNGQLTWWEPYSYEGFFDEVFFYDGTSVIQLTNNNYEDAHPQINAKGQIVWDTGDSSINGIYFYNGMSIIQLAKPGFRPVISDNGHILWYGVGGLYLYDGITTRHIWQGTNIIQYPSSVNVNGQAVWTVGNGLNYGGYEIYLYDGTSARQFTNNTYCDMSAQINDKGQILWMQIDTQGQRKLYLATPTITDPPTANAGPDQTVHVDTLVTLDGSRSSDPNGSSLTYAWSFVSKPTGSNAALSDSSIVNPTFTPDKAGDYVIQLVVTDTAGLTSQPDTVTVSTLNSPPVADAGPDQAITAIGTVVQLNGSQSYDPDGQLITYQWSILAKPAGSNATLDAPTAVKPSFVADVHGDYSIQLIVTDSLGTASSPAIVKVSFSNVAPVANAGLSQSAIVGQPFTLDGRGSTDANGDPLTYKWAINSAPSGSQAVINDLTAQITSFVPDLPGTFVVQLIVNDSFLNSDPATAQIEAISAQTKVTQDIHSSQQAIVNIDPSAFKNITMQNAALNKLNAVIASIEAGNYTDALEQLQNDILGKTDGCATSGAPDKNDWILNCDAQNSVYPALLNIITEVQALGQ